MTSGSTVVNLIDHEFGNRASKTLNGVATTERLVDDLNITGGLQVLDEPAGPIGPATVQRTLTCGLQRISQDQYGRGWRSSYFQYDGGASLGQLTSSIGQLTDSCEYDRFGNSLAKIGTTPNNDLYRGEQYDSDPGLYYLRAGYGNPATGTRSPRAS